MSQDWMSNNQRVNYEDFDETSTLGTERAAINVAVVYKDDHREESDNYFVRFGKSVRGFWSTRQTDDIEENRDLLIKTALRELIIYIMFLIVLMIIAFGMTNGLSFYFTNILTNLYLNAPFANGAGSYASAAAISDYWSFITGPLLTGLYWNQWYNNLPLSAAEQNLIYFENKLVGLPRLRQIRVQNNSCTIADNFKSQMQTCYASYSPSVESTDPFGLANSTAWTYTSQAALDGRFSWGVVTSYGGGGYYVDLNQTQADSLNTINSLFNNLWIDRATRAVIIDFTVYNANINLFCVIKLVAEFPATGGLIPTYEFRTVKLIRYVTPMDYFVLGCELLYLAFILYYIVEEIIEIRRMKFEYFSTFWNCLDIVVIAISIVSISFNIHRTILVQNSLQNLLMNTGQFPNFDYISSWQINFNYSLALTLYFSWVKLFKYITFNKTMSSMGITLGRCAKELIGFSVMFFIVFLAFAQLGYLLFSSSCADFKGMPDAIYALFRLLLGDFNFQQFRQANSIFGPIYFFLYVFFVFFVLFNMFIAIINDTYSDVKEQLSNEENEFQMGDYFKQRANFIISKLNLKKEKIMDIQNAIGMADTDGDDKIDFDEWKTELKKRGYEDEEIEKVFSRYDLDGDRVIDFEERKKMQAELESQKKEVNSDIHKTEHEVKKTGNKNDNSESMAPAVNMDDFHALTSRVDVIEGAMSRIVTKIDGVLKNIGNIEKTKSNRSETMGLILDTLTSGDNLSEEEKRRRVEDLVNEEILKLNRESFTTKSGHKSGPDFYGKH